MSNNAHLIALSAMIMLIICSGHNIDYHGISSNQNLNYYHYPTPKGAQFHETSSSSHRHYSSIKQYYQQHSPSQSQSYTYQHHQQYPSSTATFVKEFTSPMLENVAFTMALSRQGYIVDDGAMSSSIVSPATNTMITTIGVQLHPHSQSVSNSNSPQVNSQNVKLPLPLGVTPITFAPLPLQAGAPYSTVRGLTSYGTPYPQRRR